MRLLLAILILYSSSILAQAPVFYNQANVYVAQNAEVHIYGDAITDGNSSILENQGLVQTYDDGNPGNFELQNLGTVASTGNFMIDNDWVNNGILQIQSGNVEMYGDSQWFLGDSVSSFWNLKLTGTDRKEQAQDIRVRSVLDLTNRELAVHANTVFIDSADVNSILFDNSFLAEGIISTDEDGFILKHVNQNESNLIPTGSSEGTFRHRPIKVQLLNGSPTDTAIITFHHHSPDFVNAFEIDIDSSLCKIQNRYFYTFNSVNAANSYQLDFAHYPTQDGFYPDVAEWNSPTWKMVYDHTDFNDPNYSYVRANLESDFEIEHYTLGYQTPVAPYLLYDSTECYNVSAYEVEVPKGEPWYEWTIINSDTTAYITNGLGTDYIDADWANNIGGWIYNQYMDTAGCWSHMDSVLIQDVGIDASFYYTHDYSSVLNTEFTFVSDLSSSVDEVEWYIENSSEWQTGSAMNTPYQYTFGVNGESAEYEVVLYAYDHEFGCLDTAYQTVLVPNVFAFYAPNTFTPNGDEDNNTFFGEASDVNWAKLEIYNRWGELLFFEEGTQLSELVWDGTFNGQVVQDGSYTYKFTIWPVNYNNGELSAFEYPGHVTVLR